MGDRDSNELVCGVCRLIGDMDVSKEVCVARGVLSVVV